MRSIMQEDWETCYICGRNQTADMWGLEKHHVFGGKNRRLSEKYGLTIHICGGRCHRNGPQSVHKDSRISNSLHMIGQRAFENVHGTREDFIRLFGKNYL